MGIDPSSLLQTLDGNKLEAVIETMYLAADADGEFSAEERQTLASNIEQLAVGSSLEARLNSGSLEASLERARVDLEREGREQRLLVVRETLGSTDACAGALGLAVRVTTADGIVRTSEREFIFYLAMALGVDQDVAADFVKAAVRAAGS